MIRKLALSSCALVALATFAGCGGTRPPAVPAGSSQRHESARIAPGDLERFREALAPHGQWLDVNPYGTVWAPLGLRAGWRPYTDGRWIYTDLGWLWLGEEPWAWAAYHYGRWTRDPDHGWLWIPSSTWGAAWVSWRRGQGWVGWAPLPPGAGWSPVAGLSLSGMDLDRELGEPAWSFVKATEFMSPKLRSRIVPVGRNSTILPLTMNVTRYATSGARPAERGMTAEGVGLGRPPAAYRVVVAKRTRLNRAEIVSGGIVEVYRPELIRGAPQRDRTYSSARAGASSTNELLARDLREQGKLDQVLRAERERLRRDQERESRTRPRGVSRDDLERRHGYEIKAQERFEEQMRELAARRKEWLANR